MMHGLKVPDALSGPGFETDETVPEQVVTRPPATVIIGTRRRGGQVDVIELRIPGHAAPDIRLSASLGRPLEPGLVAKLALLRDDVKRPAELSRPSIKRLHVSRRHGGRAASGQIEDVTANDEHVPSDERPAGCQVRRTDRIANSVGEIDLPVVSKPW